MLRQEVEILNKLGLHARPSAKLAQLAGDFDCEIWMERGERRINAKSIMGVMMLAAGFGKRIMLETSGSDEADAMQAISELIASRFGEAE
ncbi:phosphocarrier protein HPr [Betaproteobacteria bacterium]|nr:phosphocarrier protein HPr [Betaproteobacteria bacterium]GHU13958.1 phosphocarrier protein HPr [Betaproteobacteria bacterium]GHU42607.1 phosphocarrier protein HPr [Betaproteobacteria bacterium]